MRNKKIALDGSFLTYERLKLSLQPSKPSYPEEYEARIYRNILKETEAWRIYATSLKSQTLVLQREFFKFSTD